MSQLSVFRPTDVDGEPRILSFATFATRVRTNQLFDVVSRAKLEHANQCCPACGRASVQTIERDDPLLNRNGAMIPRTASLAGFACRGCGNTWLA
jgi:hypothetical protein